MAHIKPDPQETDPGQADLHTDLQRAIDELLDAHAPDWSTTAGLLIAHPAELEALRLLSDVSAGCRRLQAADSTPRPPPLFCWGDLEVREQIASGSSAEIFRAYDPGLGIEVALKLHRDAAHSPPAGRFLAEARHLARVRQRNIVGVYGATVHAGRAGLWCEWVDGATLADLLREQGPFAAVEAAYVGIELCHALSALHGAGLLHGDLKPGNVLRERGGRIVLVDLGAGGAPGEVNAASIEYGTPAYLPPEVLAGAERRPEHDLYALGRLLQTLLAGAPDSPPPDSVSGTMLDVLTRATAAEPVHRYLRAADLEHDLIAALTGMIGVAVPLPPRTRRRLPKALATAALLLALLVAAVVYWNGVGTQWQTDIAFKRRGAAVDAALVDGSALVSGDRVLLEFRSSVPSYAYVLNEDASGALHVLFPLPGLAQHNPLPADTQLQLPGRDGVRDLSWELSGDSPREEFLVVVARAPLIKLERRLTLAPRAAYEPQRGVQTIAAQLPPALQVKGVALAGILDELEPELADRKGVLAYVFHFHRDSAAN